jgi:hypothetical protein
MNTISTYAGRDKYFKSTLETALRNMLVAEKVCRVDRTDLKRIQNPYGTEASAAITVANGTYAISDITITDDDLDVTDEVKVAEHIFNFEEITSAFNLYADRMDSMMYAVAKKIDNHVVNVVCEAAGQSYSTPTGGFTQANTLTIVANLLGKVGAYTEGVNGKFLIIEETDLPGVILAAATNGFTYADYTLQNGRVANLMGVDIYVVASGTFANATTGSETYTNSGHRVFGIKGVATYATPRGLQMEEKPVSGKTGKEVVVFASIGVKVWAPKVNLFVDITIS